jgi:hypothetical protein
MARWLALLLLVAGCRQPGPAGPVHFAREEVWLDVRPGVLVVSATYHFTCAAKQPVIGLMSYPFPVDSLNPYPDSIVIARYESGPPAAGLAARSFERNDTAVVFPLRFAPGREDSFFAWYRQPLRSNSARYIVTSTRQWRRPIDRASFRVSVPARFRAVELSFEPDSVVIVDSIRNYYFTRRQFWPDRDVVVEWAR